MGVYHPGPGDVTTSALARKIGIYPENLGRTATREGWVTYRAPNGWRYFPPESQVKAIAYYDGVRRQKRGEIPLGQRQPDEVIAKRREWLDDNPWMRRRIRAYIRMVENEMDAKRREERRRAS